MFGFRLRWTTLNGLVNGKDSVAHRDVYIVIRNAPRSEFLEEVFFHGLAGPVFIMFIIVSLLITAGMFGMKSTFKRNLFPQWRHSKI